MKVKRGATTTGTVLGVTSRTTVYRYEWEYGDMVTGSTGENAMYIAKSRGSWHHVIFFDRTFTTGTIPDHLIRPLTEPLP